MTTRLGTRRCSNVRMPAKLTTPEPGAPGLVFETLESTSPQASNPCDIFVIWQKGGTTPRSADSPAFRQDRSTVPNGDAGVNPRIGGFCINRECPLAAQAFSDSDPIAPQREL
jgi:hypothetical protein